MWGRGSLARPWTPASGSPGIPEVQRQRAIQRLQEQEEKERQMRLEQQKQTIQMWA